MQREKIQSGGKEGRVIVGEGWSWEGALVGGCQVGQTKQWRYTRERGGQRRSHTVGSLGTPREAEM